MNALLYYVILLPISRLPYWVLYRISDILYLVLYKVVGYRKKVVRQNLERSFPAKSLKEIKVIERGFYRHLGDLVVEGVKNFTVSGSKAIQQMRVVNAELLDGYHQQGRSVILVGGHYNNWELFALALPGQVKHIPLALFTPLNNKFWNEKVTSSRSKYGTRMMRLQTILEKLKTQKALNAVIFGNDQSPRKSQRARFTTFMNQETGVTYGAERTARDLDLPVFYGSIQKIGRGRYEVSFTLVSDDHSQFQEGEITDAFTARLEQDILAAPQYWLWSHKRWKHKKAEHDTERLVQ